MCYAYNLYAGIFYSNKIVKIPQINCFLKLLNERIESNHIRPQYNSLNKPQSNKSSISRADRVYLSLDLEKKKKY